MSRKNKDGTIRRHHDVKNLKSLSSTLYLVSACWNVCIECTYRVLGDPTVLLMGGTDTNQSRDCNELVRPRQQEGHSATLGLCQSREIEMAVEVRPL